MINQNCKICNIEYIKGIGECCSRQCHNIKINSRPRTNDSHVVAARNRELKYNSNPIKCKQCDNFLNFDAYKSKFKFCSQSCSATHYNSKRDKKLYEQQSMSMKLRIELDPTDNRSVKWPKSIVNFKNCEKCNKAFRSINGKTYCSNVCKAGTNIKTYRRACKFTMTKISHPELFDYELLSKHGWYRPANHKNGYNPDGATWDHLFRIEDGFKLNVLPDIISHPANAQMISWRENKARSSSTITYDELLERIKNWK